MIMATFSSLINLPQWQEQNTLVLATQVKDMGALVTAIGRLHLLLAHEGWVRVHCTAKLRDRNLCAWSECKVS